MGLGVPLIGQSLDDATYDNPSIRKIAVIEVKGTQSLDKSSIIALTGLKVGDDLRVPAPIKSGTAGYDPKQTP